MIEDKVIGWNQRLNRHEFTQTLGDSEGQGSLACRSPWGYKELDMTEQLNDNSLHLDGIEKGQFSRLVMSHSL